VNGIRTSLIYVRSAILPGPCNRHPGSKVLLQCILFDKGYQVDMLWDRTVFM